MLQRDVGVVPEAKALKRVESFAPREQVVLFKQKAGKRKIDENDVWWPLPASAVAPSDTELSPWASSPIVCRAMDEMWKHDDACTLGLAFLATAC